ncbi:MAG: hypothetical protein J6X55_11050 [Victivallales bacterium]|nr:hypothetical protein [Victivallales bacterium]
MKRWIFMMVQLVGGVAMAFQILFQDELKKHDPSQWQTPSIFLPFSAITYTDNGMVLSRNEKQEPIPGRKFDTAFELKTVRKQLPADAEYFEFSLKIGTNKSELIKSRGYNSSYHKCIKWFDEEENLMGLFTYSPDFRFPLDAPGWYSWRGKIPAKAKTMEVNFGFDYPDFEKGEMAIISGFRVLVGSKADIAAEETLGGLSIKPVLLSKSPTENANDPVKIQVDFFRAFSKNAKVTLLYDDKDITNDVQWNNDVLSYLPDGGFAPGAHFITFVRNAGDSDEKKHFVAFSISKPRTKNVMGIRASDGMATLDGKPFFLLGLSCLRSVGRSGFTHDGAFAEAKEAGINFARNGSGFMIDFPDAAKYLDAAKKHKIFIAWSPTRAKNCTDVKEIVKGILRQMDLDSVLCWEIGDDTLSHITADELIEVNRAIKAVDNSRLTVQADFFDQDKSRGDLMTISRYTSVTAASDIFKPELYPVGCCKAGTETPEITARAIPTVIRDMKQIHQDRALTGKGRSPIWPLVQYFHYDPKGNVWNRLPTHDELRAMSYLAVIHGSHGVYWYRYSGYPNTENFRRGFSDEQWNTLKSVILEFRSLYDMYCTEPIPQVQKAVVVSGSEKDALGFDAANTLLKEWNGKKYLLTCNSAYNDATFKFTVPGASKAVEYFEKRTLPMNNGEFQDTFGPFGVHVYVLE